MICQKSAKIDAAYVTADTSFDATNIEPPMAPLDSALKTGLDTVLWRHDISLVHVMPPSSKEVPCPGAH